MFVFCNVLVLFRICTDPIPRWAEESAPVLFNDFFLLPINWDRISSPVRRMRSRIEPMGLPNENDGRQTMPKSSSTPIATPRSLSPSFQKIKCDSRRSLTVQEYKRSELQTFAERLEKAKCGGSITVGKNNYVCILKVPPLSETCVLHPGVIVLQSSRMLRELCELLNSLMGIRTKWTCKIKDSGRLLEQCSTAGRVSMGRGNGIRSRHSQKVGCTAVARTLSISSFSDLKIK